MNDEVTPLEDGTYQHSITFEPFDWPQVYLSASSNTRPWWDDETWRSWRYRVYDQEQRANQPPQHAYRQTHRGRVPRLTPAMRTRQRELRRRGGRR